MDQPTTDKSEKIALVLVALVLVALLASGLSDRGFTQTLFVQTTYFFLMVTVLCWAGTYLYAGRDLRREQIVA